MDPEKVDNVMNWKVPINKQRLQGFLGSVGYLADDIARVRIPMGILLELTGKDTPWRWTELHQRAFEEIQEETERFRNHSRVPLNYDDGAPTINLLVWLAREMTGRQLRLLRFTPLN